MNKLYNAWQKYSACEDSLSGMSSSLIRLGSGSKSKQASNLRIASVWMRAEVTSAREKLKRELVASMKQQDGATHTKTAAGLTDEQKEELAKFFPDLIDFNPEEDMPGPADFSDLGEMPFDRYTGEAGKGKVDRTDESRETLARRIKIRDERKRLHTEIMEIQEKISTKENWLDNYGSSDEKFENYRLFKARQSKALDDIRGWREELSELSLESSSLEFSSRGMDKINEPKFDELTGEPLNYDEDQEMRASIQDMSFKSAAQWIRFGLLEPVFRKLGSKQIKKPGDLVMRGDQSMGLARQEIARLLKPIERSLRERGARKEMDTLSKWKKTWFTLKPIREIWSTLTRRFSGVEDEGYDALADWLIKQTSKGMKGQLWMAGSGKGGEIKRMQKIVDIFESPRNKRLTDWNINTDWRPSDMKALASFFYKIAENFSHNIYRQEGSGPTMTSLTTESEDGGEFDSVSSEAEDPANILMSPMSRGKRDVEVLLGEILTDRDIGNDDPDVNYLREYFDTILPASVVDSAERKFIKATDNIDDEIQDHRDAIEEIKVGIDELEASLGSTQGQGSVEDRITKVRGQSGKVVQIRILKDKEAQEKMAIKMLSKSKDRADADFLEAGYMVELFTSYRLLTQDLERKVFSDKPEGFDEMSPAEQAKYLDSVMPEWFDTLNPDAKARITKSIFPRAMVPGAVVGEYSPLRFWVGDFDPHATKSKINNYTIDPALVRIMAQIPEYQEKVSKSKTRNAVLMRNRAKNIWESGIRSSGPLIEWVRRNMMGDLTSEERQSVAIDAVQKILMGEGFALKGNRGVFSEFFNEDDELTAEPVELLNRFQEYISEEMNDERHLALERAVHHSMNRSVMEMFPEKRDALLNEEGRQRFLAERSAHSHIFALLKEFILQGREQLFSDATMPAPKTVPKYDSETKTYRGEKVKGDRNLFDALTKVQDHLESGKDKGKAEGQLSYDMDRMSAQALFEQKQVTALVRSPKYQEYLSKVVVKAMDMKEYEDKYDAFAAEKGRVNSLLDGMRKIKKSIQTQIRRKSSRKDKDALESLSKELNIVVSEIGKLLTEQDSISEAEPEPPVYKSSKPTPRPNMNGSVLFDRNGKRLPPGKIKKTPKFFEAERKAKDELQSILQARRNVKEMLEGLVETEHPADKDVIKALDILLSVDVNRGPVPYSAAYQIEMDDKGKEIKVPLFDEKGEFQYRRNPNSGKIIKMRIPKNSLEAVRRMMIRREYGMPDPDTIQDPTDRAVVVRRVEEERARRDQDSVSKKRFEDFFKPNLTLDSGEVDDEGQTILVDPVKAMSEKIQRILDDALAPIKDISANSTMKNVKKTTKIIRPATRNEEAITEESMSFDWLGVDEWEEWNDHIQAHILAVNEMARDMREEGQTGAAKILSTVQSATIRKQFGVYLHWAKNTGETEAFFAAMESGVIPYPRPQDDPKAKDRNLDIDELAQKYPLTYLEVTDPLAAARMLVSYESVLALNLERRGARGQKKFESKKTRKRKTKVSPGQRSLFASKRANRRPPVSPEKAARIMRRVGASARSMMMGLSNIQSNTPNIRLAIVSEVMRLSTII